jgi:antitoxin component YwqK of YwqJK toxin-antitoxin module
VVSISIFWKMARKISSMLVLMTSLLSSIQAQRTITITIEGDTIIWTDKNNPTGHGILCQDGIVTTFSKNNNKIVEFQVAGCRRQGFWKEFYSNGKIRAIEYYDRNLPIGTWEKYSRKGKLRKQRRME